MRPKINQKSILKTMRKQKASETRFLSIFVGIGSHLGPPKRSQDAQKSMLKGRQNLINFLKASWNTNFSAKEPARGASAANRRSGRSRPEATGGGFRRGKQEPPRRRIRKEDGRKDSETSCAYLSTPTPLGGGFNRLIEEPLGGSTAAARF